MTDDFKLPDDIFYKIRFEGRNIYVGPILGLIIVSKHSILTQDFLEKYKPYLTHYNDINGLVFIGSSEGIDVDSKTIKGYYYQPKGDINWIESKFPYPNALYRRIGIADYKYNDLISNIGDKIFNTYFFDKWDLWECLSPYDKIRLHLPHTEKLKDMSLLDNMIATYEIVFLKRTNGEKAKGIFKVFKTERGYHLIDRAKNEKVFKDILEVSKFLKTVEKRNGEYIVQQGLRMKNFEERSFDLRVVMQKDESKQWTFTSMIARFGGSGRVASNIGLDGFAMLGIDAIKKVFNLNDKEVFLKQQEIIVVCKMACDMLDKTIGHYGDLGIDVVIDENQKIWILEINKLHYHPYAVYALKNRQMYYDVAATPIKYANALSGFK